MRAYLIILVAGVVLPDCASSSEQRDGTLDCAWQEGYNCWKVTTDAAQSCLPPPDAEGTFSADNAVCTYASGQIVTFSPALSYPFESSGPWDFTISSAGQMCMHYQQTAGGDVTLTVGADTFLVTQLGPGAVRFTCPDGATYSTTNSYELLSCPGGSNTGPASSVSINIRTSEGTGIRFTLQGTSSSSGLPIFHCIKP